ncbi:MAG: SH3 domain-containing protein [Caldilineaceae bacterium]|nr:SH3 domain-containing protein [Caldilineaceae bacterium]MBP8107376.1 SH3 domain-containing protein [Caldilineaceae bacterium]MBP8121391.1 SH3 domain-containing protein [Caldilineaceae bacterium]MBP9070696.1 SH3 domain-containing protein [Caldilineaceae bacterium]
MFVHMKNSPMKMCKNLKQMVIVFLMLIVLFCVPTPYLTTVVQAQEPPPTIWTDEVLDLPVPEQPNPEGPLSLTGIDATYIALPQDPSGYALAGTNGSNFLDLKNVASNGKASVQEYPTYTTAHFWYQYRPGNWSQGRYRDDAFNADEAAAIKTGVNLMTWVLDTQFDSLMTCATSIDQKVVPNSYIINRNGVRQFDTERFSRDMRLTFRSNKQVYIVIGAYDDRRDSDGFVSEGITWSSVIDSSPKGLGSLKDIATVNNALIGINLNVGPDMKNYNFPFDGPNAAATIFHEILHNFSFNHRVGESPKNSDYIDRTKSILRLEDCLRDIARNHATIIKSEEDQSLWDHLNRSMASAPVQTSYQTERGAFTVALVASLPKFKLPDFGITQSTMTAALMRPDVGTRINGIINGVWGNWQRDVGQGDPFWIDPADFGQSPMRELVIRMVQFRGDGLSASQQRALFSLFTRQESEQSWQSNIDGIVGAINRESFTWSGSPVNNPSPASNPQPVGNPSPVVQSGPKEVRPRVIIDTKRLTDFEVFGVWRRGDESWGTFNQSSEQHHSGTAAGKFTYNFPANEPNNYLVFLRTLPIAGQPDALRVWVYGDGSTHFLNTWVQDANGQTWQYTFGRINHTGWQEMVAPLDLTLGWPNQAVGSATSATPVFPIKLYALVLDGYTSDRAFQGNIYIDDLDAITYEGSNSANPTRIDTGVTVGNQESVSITSAALNVRSGPGTAYGIVTKVKQGEIYPVLSRDVATGWVQIAIDTVASGNGWVSGQYVSISSSTAPRTQPTSTQPSNGPAPQTLVTDFETFGTWQRGDESWGTFVQSTEQKQSGRNAGKFTYDFPAGEPNNYIVFRRTISIAGQPTALRLQVYGDSSTHFLNAWVQDARGQLWQFTFGRINHSGWQSMDAPLDLGAGWPNGAIGHSATSITYPIKLYALTLDGYTSDRAFSGVVYVDDLEAITQ